MNDFPSLTSALQTQSNKKKNIGKNWGKSVVETGNIWDNPKRLITIHTTHDFAKEFPEINARVCKTETKDELLFMIKNEMIEYKRRNDKIISDLNNAIKCVKELNNIYLKNKDTLQLKIDSLVEQINSYINVNNDLTNSLSIVRQRIKILQEKLSKYEKVKFFKVRNMQLPGSSIITNEKALLQCNEANINAKHFKLISHTCPICYDNNKEVDKGFVGCHICSSMICTECIMTDLEKKNPRSEFNMNCHMCRSTMNHFIMWKCDDSV